MSEERRYTVLAHDFEPFPDTRTKGELCEGSGRQVIFGDLLGFMGGSDFCRDCGQMQNLNRGGRFMTHRRDGGAA